jgi:hypothetical protein
MKRVLTGLLVLLCVVALGAVVSVRRQTRALASALAADARTLAARTVVLDASRTDVLACFVREGSRAPALSTSLPWVSPDVRSVVEGRTPLSTLDPEHLAVVTANEPWLDRTLACADRGFIAASDGLGSPADPTHPNRERLAHSIESVVATFGLSVRADLAARQPAHALARCRQVFTLAAGVVRLEGLENMLGALQLTRLAARPCVDAALAAGTDDARREADGFARARATLPSAAQVMELERLTRSIHLFGALVPLEAARELPPGPRALTAASGVANAHSLSARLALSLYWKRYDSTMRAVVTACELEGPARTAAIRARLPLFDAPWLKRLLVAEPVDTGLDLYVDELDQLRAMFEVLDLLVAGRAGRPLPSAPLVSATARGAETTVAPNDPSLAWLTATFRP